MVESASGGRRRPRVLFLDDDERTVRALKRALADEIDIVGATTAARAIEILASDEHLDAAIFDIMGVAGYSVVEEARTYRGLRFPIAMFSGSSEAAEINPAALAKPPIPFLAKGESTEDMRRWIREVTSEGTREEDVEEPPLIQRHGPLHRIRALVVDGRSGESGRGGDLLRDALLYAGADARRVSAAAVLRCFAGSGTYDIVFVRLHCAEPASVEAGIGVAREIERVQLSPPVILFVVPGDPKPEIAIATGDHRRLVDLDRLVHLEGGGPEPRLVPFVLAVVAAARAVEGERCLRAELPPLVVPRTLPNPFPLQAFLHGPHGVESLALRLVRSECKTETEAAALLNVPRSRFPLRKPGEPRGLRQALHELADAADASRVLVYSRSAPSEQLLLAFRAAGLDTLWEEQAHRVTRRIVADRCGAAVLHADACRDLVVALAIRRLSPGTPAFLIGAVSLVTWLLAGRLDLRGRLVGEVQPTALTALVDRAWLRISATESRDRERARLGGHHFEDVSSTGRADAFELDRFLEDVERDVILLALDQYGSEHKAAEPLGMKRSSLRERIRCLGISRRGRSPTPPSVPQVP